MDVREFVAKFIKQERYYVDVAHFRAIVNREDMELEVNDIESIPERNTKGDVVCVHPLCHGEAIADDESEFNDIFSHIRDEHPSVTGLTWDNNGDN